MLSPIQVAIANFVDHCQAIPNALGSPGSKTPILSTNQHTLNIPYPNGITISGSDNPDSQLSQIRQLLAGRPTDATTSIVDSYSSLDLTPLGFHAIFETPWSFRSPAPVEPQQTSEPQPRVESVNTPAQLQEFDRVAAVGFGQPDADIVYSAPLLSDHRYGFYFIRHSNNVVAGIQTFTNNDSIGIYTLFTLPEFQQKGLATRLVEHALASEMNLPAITNPSDDSERIFEKAGFTNIGTRTIWLHAPD
ncbi:MAG: GNAT family N-acetyltransferase [Chloroflexi bacterium]|jgi:GNAT superfamily N-acetyltransferase|nr:GNAT family N-acetyltransferase [Chloroflexota bacterium]MBT5628640.1 GNAT family N-acetyltransferase [Chloroflexota bacterium]